MNFKEFYPTRTRKSIRRSERYCSGLLPTYLFKYVVDEKDGWYHVVECIGKKKYVYKSVTKERYLFRHYIVPHYDYYHDHDHPVISLISRPYDINININLVHKKYNVTTYEYK